MFLAFRGWSVLVLAPMAALTSAAFAGDPLLAHWTQTFMGSAARFVAQFFPIFLLGAMFGKLMEDSGSVSAIARFMTESLGPRRAVLAGAAVTYGGVSLFVAFFSTGPHGASAVPGSGHSAPVDARSDCSWHIHLHHVGPARNSVDQPIFQWKLVSQCIKNDIKNQQVMVRLAGPNETS